jgi:hypothetical protein
METVLIWCPGQKQARNRERPPPAAEAAATDHGATAIRSAFSVVTLVFDATRRIAWSVALDPRPEQTSGMA